MSAIPAAKNEPIDTKIRKFRDTLITGGFAIIAFGIWTVIKSIMEAFTILKPMIGNMTLENLTQAQEDPGQDFTISNRDPRGVSAFPVPLQPATGVND